MVKKLGGHLLELEPSFKSQDVQDFKTKWKEGQNEEFGEQDRIEMRV